MHSFDMLRKLCLADGVSGDEDTVRNIILDEITPFADKIEVSPLGNIIAFKSGGKRAPVKLMLSAHMDEVGFIITHITDGGLLKFDTVGGIDRRILPGKPVLLSGGVQGVIGVKPIHLLKKGEEGKSVPLDELYIDIGALSREEAEKYAVLGSTAAFVSSFDTSHGMIESKALDDRAGCAILVDIIKSDLKYDMVFVFTVQEEAGLNGAKTAANHVRPEAAIVVECTTAADVPGSGNAVCRLGGGAAVSFMDRRTIYDKAYFKEAFAAAKAAKVKCQPKTAVAGGNDAGAIHACGSGVRTAAVSVPCRYIHSPAGMISQKDFLSAEKVVTGLAERIAGGHA